MPRGAGPRSRTNRTARPTDHVRRGVTLLEALLATVLLAMLVVAALPLLRPPANGPDPVTRSDRRVALSLFADTLMQTPAALGLAAIPQESLVLEWPVELAEHEALRGLPLSPVSISLLRSTDDKATHGWLICSMGEVTLARWVPVSPVAKAEQPEVPGGP